LEAAETPTVRKGARVTTRKISATTDWPRPGKTTRDGRGVITLPLSRLRGPRAEVPLERILQDVEAALIRQSLERATSVQAAAHSLGLSPEVLSAKMRRLGMAQPS
jgi:DNA-binding NtrC family response regulator